mgnify:CR=1 FL=1
MVGPHQDNGVPWTISSPTSTPTQSPPINTGTPNFGGQGTGGNNQTPPPPLTLQQEASTYQPSEPSSTDYGGVFGDYDITQPMGTGFGSVFGASSGTTGSSETVQDVLTYMMESELDKGLTPEQAAFNAYSNFYNEGNLMDIDSDDPFFETNRTIADDWIGRKYDQLQSGYGGGGGWDSGRNILDDRRAWQQQLFYGPRQSPQRAMEQQGFFDTMINPYAEDTAKTLEEGLYSQSFVHPGAGVMPWGMEKIWATGRAKGGIVSLVGG